MDLASHLGTIPNRTPLFASYGWTFSEGSYRAVVGLEHDFGTETERVAMKDILYE